MFALSSCSFGCHATSLKYAVSVETYECTGGTPVIQLKVVGTHAHTSIFCIYITSNLGEILISCISELFLGLCVFSSVSHE